MSQFVDDDLDFLEDHGGFGKMTFAKALSIVAKDQPGGGDVHVPSAGGTGGKKKPRPFSSFLPTRKAADGTDIELKFTVAKDAAGAPVIDSDHRLVFGWASVIEENGQPVEDSQGDVIDEATLEKAFYGFAEEMGKADEMHDETDGGPLVECMVFTKEKQRAMGIDLKKVGAWVGFRVRPDIFAKVKTGDYGSFSIGGRGLRTPI